MWWHRFNLVSVPPPRSEMATLPQFYQRGMSVPTPLLPHLAFHTLHTLFPALLSIHLIQWRQEQQSEGLWFLLTTNVISDYNRGENGAESGFILLQ